MSLSGDNGFSIRYSNTNVTDDLTKSTTIYLDNGTESSDDEAQAYSSTSTTILISGGKVDSTVNTSGGIPRPQQIQ